MRTLGARGYWLTNVPVIGIERAFMTNMSAKIGNLMLKFMVGRWRVPAPGAVYDPYGHILEDFAEPEDQFAGSTASLLTARP
jgi:hypothetical protein